MQKADHVLVHLISYGVSHANLFLVHRARRAGCLSARAGETDTFFNGKDLAGWEGLIDPLWSVKDGAIVGLTPKEGQKFNNPFCAAKRSTRTSSCNSRSK
jgi:hypothetical protein